MEEINEEKKRKAWSVKSHQGRRVNECGQYQLTMPAHSKCC